MTVVDQQQRLAALNPLSSFCVTAPAGSGKTELLIQRYLTLLARVERPEQVLAITFTRKAAAEMRARVLEALISAKAGDPCESDHQQHTRTLAIDALAADEAGQWRLIGNISRINIKTIDGYCAALTRQMPILSEFGGQADVVENPVELYNEAVVELFKVIETESELADDLAALMLHFDNNWVRLQELLVSMLARRDQWRSYIGVHHQAEEAESYLLHTVKGIVVDALTDLFGKLAPYQQDILALQTYASEHLETSAPAGFPGCAPDDLSSWRSVRALLLTAGKNANWRARVDKRMGFPAGKGIAQEQKDKLTQLITELSEIEGLLDGLKAVSSLPQIGLQSESWRLVLHLSRVLPRLAAELLLVFQRRGQVDHNQVSLSALQALGEDELPTDLALRLDYQLEHILVDEFQDTAINQFELVRRLTRGWGDHNDRNPYHPRTLLIVGDGMQSIYGFRDANVGLFIQARNEGFNGVQLEPLSLQSNFRSDAGIVDWVNQTFEQAFPSSEDVSKGEIRFSGANAVRPAKPEVAVSLKGFCGDDAQRDEILAIGETVKQGIDTKDCRSIAILARTRGHLQGILARLKELEISYSAQDIDSLASSSVIVDLMSLCRALANPADRLAWMSLLRAPYCGLSLRDLHVIGSAGDVPVYTTIRSLLTNTDVLQKLSEEGKVRVGNISNAMDRAQRNRDRQVLRTWVESLWLALGGPRVAAHLDALKDAERFFQLLEQAERESQGLNLSWLQNKLERLYVQAENPDSKVHVMTLHKAKGLEFDWVIIPSLSKSTRVNSKPLLLWDDHSSGSGERGFLLAADDHSKDDEPTLYNWLKGQRATKEILETTRLLYVGVTRAAQRLFLTSEVKFDDKKEDFRDPSNRSLLACIWPLYKTQMSVQESLPGEVEASNNRTVSRRIRLGQKSILALGNLDVNDEIIDVSAGANIPELKLNTVDRYIGTVVHLALEQMSRLEVLPEHIAEVDRLRWHSALANLGLYGKTLDGAAARVEKSVACVLADSHGRWILSPHNEEGFSELAVTIVDDEGRVSDLIIDRTFLDPQTNHRWVIDYKNSEPDDGQSLEDFALSEARTYAGQLSSYKKAVEALYHQPVKCALYFTALGHLHELSI